MPRQLVLFVHGLGGEPQTTWGAFPALLSSDPDFRQTDLGYFSYPTPLFRLPFSRITPRVQTLAGALQTLIENRYFSYDQISLVCHSLGGLIGKQYLLDQVEQGRELRVKSLLLFAVPNNGAGLASVGAFISWRHRQLRQLCRQSDLVRDIATTWHRRQMAEKVSVTYVIAGLDRAVDELSARESWGNVAVEVIADRDHRSVVKPTLPSDLPYVILRNKLLNRTNATKEISPNLRFSAAALMSQPTQDIRVSMSAIIRIARGDRYALIRNIRRPENFTPIGGVYKYFRDGQVQLDSFDFRAQVTDTEMAGDIRGFLPSNNFEEFLSWFGKGHGRETAQECLQRELREELAQVGLQLELDELAGVRFSHVRTVREGPELLAAENYHQYRIIDVYDLDLESAQGRDLLSKIQVHADRGKDIVWATSQEIIRGRDRFGNLIGSHTPYLFGKVRYRSHEPAFWG
jgi:pimeloyl-ACP methyl ester carboxylesterase